MKRFNFYRMGKKGGFSIISDLRNVKLGVLKKHKIKKLLRNEHYGKYKVTKKGSTVAVFMVTKRADGSFMLKKGKNGNNDSIKRKKSDEYSSIEVGFKPANHKNYKVLERYYTPFIDEDLKRRIESLIEEHDIDNGIFDFIVRKRLGNGVLDEKILKYERIKKEEGRNIVDTLKDAQTGQVIFNNINPGLLKKIMKGIETGKKMREERIAKAKAEQEKRML